MKTSLFLTTAMAALLVTGVAAAEKTTYIIAAGEGETDVGLLAGDKEIPAVNDADTGSARFTYDSETKKLCGKITFTPAEFAWTAAHIHEGDDKEANGPAYIFLVPQGAAAGTGTITVNVELDDAQVTALTTKENYVNIHSAEHTGGAMRGQLIKDPEATDADAEPCGEQTGGGGGTPDAGTGGASSSSSSSGSTGTDGGAKSSSGSTAVAPDSTDDGGGCNTTGSTSGNALAFLAGLGVVIAAAASRKRKQA